jgi:cytochrome c oxidase subunit 4
MNEKIVPIKLYLKNWAALLLLLLLTVGAAYINLGAFNTVIALTIAVIKAFLIVLIFMHIKWSEKLLHLAAVAGILWLGIMIALVLGDYLTRTWILGARH